MWISRLRVTGGFLAGVDIRFDPRLNVVIGPRGAGKTTMLELARHALGTPHADRARADREARRVQSMLGDGDVVLDIEDNDTSLRLVVDADGGGRRPDVAEHALMLGQNELESIASDAESRLRLVDLRARAQTTPVDWESIVTCTRQLYQLRNDIANLEERSRQRIVLQADLDALEVEENSLMGRVSAEMTAKRELLRTHENHLLNVQSESAQIESASELLDRLTRTNHELVQLVDEAGVLPLPEGVGRSMTVVLRNLEPLSRQLGVAIEASVEALRSHRVGRSQIELEIRGQAETLRAELNKAERGLGELTARIRRVRTELARLEQDQRRRDEMTRKYLVLYEEREHLLDEAEKVSELLYNDRIEIANGVSEHLTARVTVAIEHLADSRDFREFLSRALQGSGLRYSAIADVLSRRLLPRQLLVLVETGDVASTSAATDLPEDRVARVLGALDNEDMLADLATVQLRDMADFLLVDGSELKSVEALSTGQKCAVTLPILLTEHARALVLDQPEDHLDNAYLVDNIVVGLNKRSAAPAQTIIATHNANIPVLGSAATVVSLRSDGRRGYVEQIGSYDDPKIVTAITTLMEGGEHAFRRRAEFYKRHGLAT